MTIIYKDIEYMKKYPRNISGELYYRIAVSPNKQDLSDIFEKLKQADSTLKRRVIKSNCVCPKFKEFTLFVNKAIKMGDEKYGF